MKAMSKEAEALAAALRRAQEAFSRGDWAEVQVSCREAAVEARMLELDLMCDEEGVVKWKP